MANAGSKVIDGEITQDCLARIIRDGTIIYNGKIVIYENCSKWSRMVYLLKILVTFKKTL